LIPAIASAYNDRCVVGLFLVSSRGTHSGTLGRPCCFAGFRIESGDKLAVDAVADQKEESAVNERRATGANPMLKIDLFPPEDD
jgi:hypothetical protein